MASQVSTATATLSINMRLRDDHHRNLHPQLDMQNDGVALNTNDGLNLVFDNLTQKDGVRVFLSWLMEDGTVDYDCIDVPIAEARSYAVRHTEMRLRGGAVRELFVGTLYHRRLGIVKTPTDACKDFARRFFNDHPHVFPPDAVHTPGAAEAHAGEHAHAGTLCANCQIEEPKGDALCPECEAVGPHHTDDILLI